MTNNNKVCEISVKCKHSNLGLNLKEVTSLLNLKHQIMYSSEGLELFDKS